MAQQDTWAKANQIATVAAQVADYHVNLKSLHRQGRLSGHLGTNDDLDLTSRLNYN